MNIFGRIVEEDGVSPGIITIEDGTITEFKRTTAPSLPGIQHSYNTSQFLIFPGFVDVNANIKDDAAAGQAAINGGITSLCDANISTITKHGYTARTADLTKRQINALSYACIDHTSTKLRKRVPYQVFVGRMNEIAFIDYTKLSQVLEQFAKQIVSFHCED